MPLDDPSLEGRFPNDCRPNTRIYTGGVFPWQLGPECFITTPPPTTPPPTLPSENSSRAYGVPYFGMY